MNIFERATNLLSQLAMHYGFAFMACKELSGIEHIVGKKDWRVNDHFWKKFKKIIIFRRYSPRSHTASITLIHTSISHVLKCPRRFRSGASQWKSMLATIWRCQRFFSKEIWYKFPTNRFQEWDEILSMRDRNVLISFGTFAKTSDMPDDYKWYHPFFINKSHWFRKNFISLFEKFPNTTFIWKYEDPEEGIFQGIDNLVLTKWMPQVPLLGIKIVSSNDTWVSFPKIITIFPRSFFITISFQRIPVCPYSSCTEASVLQLKSLTVESPLLW